MVKRLDNITAERGLQDKVRAFRCSHVGGHKVSHIYLMIPFLIKSGQGACASASFGAAGLASMNIRQGKLAGSILNAICWGVEWPAHDDSTMECCGMPAIL